MSERSKDLLSRRGIRSALTGLAALLLLMSGGAHAAAQVGTLHTGQLRGAPLHPPHAGLGADPGRSTTPAGGGAPAGSVTVDYIVPTGDAALFLEVVHPVDASGKIIPAPVILTYTPYSALGRNGDAAHWVNEKGYTRATADVIGTGNSGGCYDYGGNREIRTVHELIDWIGAQSWSESKVAMLGASYEGTTQYAAAISHPKDLVTIVPEAAIDRWYDYAYSGGIRYTDSNEQFSKQGPLAASDEGVDTPAAFDFGFAVPPPTDYSGADWQSRVLSRVRLCEQLTHTNQAYSDTPDYNGFWKERDYLRQMGRVHIPVLVAHNWGDWNVKQANSWQIINALRNSPDSRGIFGDRWHGHGVPQDDAVLSYSGTLDRWMDHWLRGAENGIPRSLARVTTRSADSSGGLSYTSAPAVKPLRLYFSGAAGGNLTPTASGRASAGWVSYEWTGLNTESGAGAAPLLPGSAAFSAGAPSGPYVTFQSAPLTHDLRIYGEPALRLSQDTGGRRWITTATSLFDFNPADHAGSDSTTLASNPDALVAITRGWLDSRYRLGLDREVLADPAKPLSETLQMKPTDYTVRAGHRLVLMVSTETLEWAKAKVYDDPSAAGPIRISASHIDLPAPQRGTDVLPTGP